MGHVGGWVQGSHPVETPTRTFLYAFCAALWGKIVYIFFTAANSPALSGLGAPESGPGPAPTGRIKRPDTPKPEATVSGRSHQD